MQSAGHGRQVLLPTALIIIPLILQAPIVLTITLPTLPALTVHIPIAHIPPAPTPPTPTAHTHLILPAPAR